ncbi:enoyl-CoA hydratase/isomerase family protein [Nocardia sp. NBC_00565]|uniref:enoyl-CoA hydratase/isomerase family protein n=1 Tax=Nocardia sp. NBC_00565 TaxID=2975993 RepID=UPI002E822D55|nr:enoyl-CoA hydratase/isomerase family protein [Nocardia sp. NBC_00565]WUC06612.1 enoyl-CoA hydratase/isomerase family protein [Nocardia sp. NBC_00565]
MTADLSVETLDGFVGVLTMRRPPNNFFDLDLVRGLADAGEELAAGDTRAIVIRSEGKHFCAGADFTRRDLGVDTARLLYTEAIRLLELPIPIVAAVQGSAVGGGLGLACAADFRVASQSSRFHCNFSQLGFHPGFGLSETLPQIVGQQRALHIMCASQRLTGQEALAIGLVDVLAEDSEMQSAAIEFARTFTAMAPLAVRSIKQTLRGGLPDRVLTAVQHEASEQQRLRDTEDFTIGLTASFERKQPIFTGR